MGKKIILLLAFLAVFAVPAMAQDEPRTADAPVSAGKSSSGLPIPRFVTLASDKVFVRTGPALRYPIKWIYQKDHFPVEIIQEFDTWRKVRDMDGDDGWVHQSLLSGSRSVIVKGEANLPVRKEASDNSRVIVMLEPNVVAALEECEGAWCRVSSEGYTGWAERKFLWGIYDAEDFD